MKPILEEFYIALRNALKANPVLREVGLYNGQFEDMEAKEWLPLGYPNALIDMREVEYSNVTDYVRELSLEFDVYFADKIYENKSEDVFFRTLSLSEGLKAVIQALYTEGKWGNGIVIRESRSNPETNLIVWVVTCRVTLTEGRNGNYVNKQDAPKTIGIKASAYYEDPRL